MPSMDWRTNRRQLDLNQTNDRTREHKGEVYHKPHDIRHGLRNPTKWEIQFAQQPDWEKQIFQQQNRYQYLYRDDSRQTNDRVQRHEKPDVRHEPYTIRRGLRKLTKEEIAEVRSLQQQENAGENYGIHDGSNGKNRGIKRQALGDLINVQDSSNSTSRDENRQSLGYETGTHHDHTQASKRPPRHFYYGHITEDHSLRRDAPQQDVKKYQDQSHINSDNSTSGIQAISSDKTDNSSRGVSDTIDYQENRRKNILHENLTISNGKRYREASDDIIDREENKKAKHDSPEGTPNQDGETEKLPNSPDANQKSSKPTKQQLSKISEKSTDNSSSPIRTENKENDDHQEVMPNQNKPTKGNVLGDITNDTHKVIAAQKEKAGKKASDSTTNSYAAKIDQKENTDREASENHPNSQGKDQRKPNPQGQQSKKSKPPQDGEGKKGKDPSELKARLAALQARREGLAQELKRDEKHDKPGHKGAKGDDKSGIQSEINSLDAEISRIRSILQPMGLA